MSCFHNSYKNYTFSAQNFFTESNKMHMWDLLFGSHVRLLGSFEPERTPIGHMFAVLGFGANNGWVPKIRPMLQDKVGNVKSDTQFQVYRLKWVYINFCIAQGPSGNRSWYTYALRKGLVLFCFCDDTPCILRTLGLCWYSHETIENPTRTLIVLPTIDTSYTKNCTILIFCVKSLEFNMSGLKWTRVEENGLK